MPANKHTKTERPQVLARIALLDGRGYSQWEIAKEIGVTQPQVCQDLKKIRQQYRDEMIRAREEMVNEKVAQYNDLIRECWKAWELSKAIAERTTEVHSLQVPKLTEKEVKQKEKVRRKAKMVKVSMTKVTEGRLPAIEYLRLIEACHKAIRELKGLDEPRKVDMRTQDVTDWSVLTQGLVLGDPSGQVEAEMRALLEDRVREQQGQGTKPIQDGSVPRPDALPNVIKVVDSPQATSKKLEGGASNGNGHPTQG